MSPSRQQPAYRNRGRRTDGPCPTCKSPDNCAYFPDGSEHCFSPGCDYHKNALETINKRGEPPLPMRRKPRKSMEALDEFAALPKANARQSYLKSKRHKGDLALRLIGNIKQDGPALVIPLYDRKGRLRNLLRIYPDGRKRLLAGVRTKSLFHRIGNGNTNRVWIVEGWATGISVHRATGDDVLVAFGCNNLLPVAEYAKSLGKKVVICGDTDERAALIAEEAAGTVGGSLFVPQFPDGVNGTDANDLAHSLGLKELRKQIDENTESIPSPPDLIEIAASLSRQEYRDTREAIAKTLGISIRELEKEVQQRNQELVFEEPEPWPKPVNGAKLLDAIERRFHRYVFLSDLAAKAMALWSVMTYVIEEISTAAILAIIGPEKRCGKSLTLGVLSRVVYRPLAASNITPAATFRVVDMYGPTLLIDEADTFFKRNEELRGIVDSGHTRETGFVLRCVGDENKPVRFRTYGAKAIAQIGELPETIADRSIIIAMRRKLVTDETKRLHRSKRGDAFHKLRRKITRWVDDNRDSIDKALIKRPKGLNDREFDNWRPLFQIAKLAGGDWEQAAVDAAVALSAHDIGQDDSVAVQLLQDLEQLFERDGEKRLSTAFILDELVQMDHRPWPEYRQRQPLSAWQMAALLKGFGIKPKVIRVGKGKTPRGYRLRDCTDAFARYCE